MFSDIFPLKTDFKETDIFSEPWSEAAPLVIE